MSFTHSGGQQGITGTTTTVITDDPAIEIHIKVFKSTKEEAIKTVRALLSNAESDLKRGANNEYGVTNAPTLGSLDGYSYKVKFKKHPVMPLTDDEIDVLRRMVTERVTK